MNNLFINYLLLLGNNDGRLHMSFVYNEVRIVIFPVLYLLLCVCVCVWGG